VNAPCRSRAIEAPWPRGTGRVRFLYARPPRVLRPWPLAVTNYARFGDAGLFTVAFALSGIASNQLAAMGAPSLLPAPSRLEVALLVVVCSAVPFPNCHPKVQLDASPFLSFIYSGRAVVSPSLVVWTGATHGVAWGRGHTSCCDAGSHRHGPLIAPGVESAARFFCISHSFVTTQPGHPDGAAAAPTCPGRRRGARGACCDAVRPTCSREPVTILLSERPSSTGERRPTLPGRTSVSPCSCRHQGVHEIRRHRSGGTMGSAGFTRA